MKNKSTAKTSRFAPLLIITLLALITFFGLNFKQTDAIPHSIPEQTKPQVSASTEAQEILAGKTMVTFGDSVTEFGHYPEVIAENTGMTVENIGFKGTRIAHHPYSSYDEFSPTKLADAIISRDFTEQNLAIQEDRNYTTDFINHYETLKTIDFNDVDIASLFIGTNDYMGNGAGAVTLGEMTDQTRETFTGAINYFVQSMQNAFPHLDLILITPTWRMNHADLGGKSAEIQPNSNGDYLIEFVDAILERGAYYDIPTLDLYRLSGLNEENHDNFFVDHVHPNHQGYELIGNTISHFLIDTYNKE
jgi:lysophospholipase L1-like esterase